MAACVSPGFSMDVYHVFLGTLDLQPPGGEHMVSLSHEYQEGTGSENPQGPRDPRTHTGRVRGGLGQGSDAGEEITDSPPEEGLTRTSPVHHPGSYSAKHTHSGSPEDA